MGITSKQIAELVGVSRGTVDRALHRRGGVKPEIQRRVEMLAREYGYRPDRAGKALVTREPLRVGVILNSKGNPFYEEVRRGLTEALGAFSDFSIDMDLRESGGYRVEDQLAAVEEAEAAGAAGLLITPLNRPEVAERLNAYIDAGHPVVALNSDIEGCRRLAYVGCDYRRSGQTAAQMMGLVTGGMGRVLVVTGSLRVMGHNQRVAGFSQVLAAHYPDLVIEDVVDTNDDEERAAEEVAAALRAHPAIDALYFSAGGVSGGVGAALREAGGRRLTIITSDLTADIRRWLEEGTVQATIGQQPYRQGYDGMKLLLDRLLFRESPETPFCYTSNEVLVRYNAD